MDIAKKIAEELEIKVSQVEAAVKLIDEGCTIPFIARYRKEVTGSLNDEQLRNLDERLLLSMPPFQNFSLHGCQIAFVYVKFFFPLCVQPCYCICGLPKILFHRQFLLLLAVVDVGITHSVVVRYIYIDRRTVFRHGFVNKCLG